MLLRNRQTPFLALTLALCLGFFPAVLIGADDAAQETVVQENVAATPKTTSSDNTVSDKKVMGAQSSTLSGLQVVIDEETGMVRAPLREERAALGANLKRSVNRSAEGLTAVEHANGMVTMDLQLRFLNVSMAQTQEDGSVSTDCLTAEDGSPADLHAEGGSHVQ